MGLCALLQITSLNSGEIDVTTVEKPLGTGERYEVTNFAIGAGYGRMLTDRVAVGFLINYFREKMNELEIPISIHINYLPIRWIIGTH